MDSHYLSETAKQWLIQKVTRSLLLMMGAKRKDQEGNAGVIVSSYIDEFVLTQLLYQIQN